MKATDYPILVIWSEEDQAYLARVFDLPGCVADGGSVEEALSNVGVVIAEWLETARELNREIPKPSDDKTFRENIATAAEQERKQFEEAAEATAKEMVEEVLPQIIAKVLERVEADQPRQSIFGGAFSRRLTLLHSG